MRILREENLLQKTSHFIQKQPKTSFSIFFLVILVFGSAVTYFQLQKQQETRQQAATPSPVAECPALDPDGSTNRCTDGAFPSCLENEIHNKTGDTYCTSIKNSLSWCCNLPKPK